MKCKIFYGDTATVSRDINTLFDEHNDRLMFKIISVTQSELNGKLIVTIIYSA